MAIPDTNPASESARREPGAVARLPVPAIPTSGYYDSRYEDDQTRRNVSKTTGRFRENALRTGNAPENTYGADPQQYQDP
jgi:hypothetical protein